MKCEEPRIAALVVVFFAVMTAVVVCVFLLHRYRKYFTQTVLTHLKILVGFLTLVMTINTQ